MQITGRRLGVPLALVLGLVGAGAVVAIDRGADDRRVTMWAAYPSGTSIREVAPDRSRRLDPTPGEVGVRRASDRRGEPPGATARRLVAAVDQALHAEAPGAAWIRRPSRAQVHDRTARNGPVTVQVGSTLRHQGRQGVLTVALTLGGSGPSAPFDWSCKAVGRGGSVMCEASDAPAGARTRAQTSVGADGSVRHLVDVELRNAGRLRLDVANDARARSELSDSPLLMEEARAVALHVVARLAS
ncbi:hypothetical protein AB0D32_04155 [Micromonospora sp. NPDC048170]|uniref:hypothetical protein n=1 Tax=Micromonospora sp. NPDC048170 TaxID=3154819 RepID=UPI0033FA620C